VDARHKAGHDELYSFCKSAIRITKSASWSAASSIPADFSACAMCESRTGSPASAAISAASRSGVKASRQSPL